MARRTPISQRIGQGILGALEAYGAAQSWQREREDSESMKRLRAAQAADLEAQAIGRQRYFDLLGSPTGVSPAALPPPVPGVDLGYDRSQTSKRLMGPEPVTGTPLGRSIFRVDTPGPSLFQSAVPTAPPPARGVPPGIMGPTGTVSELPGKGDTSNLLRQLRQEGYARPTTPTPPAPDLPRYVSGVTQYSITPEPPLHNPKEVELHRLAEFSGLKHYPSLEETQEHRTWRETEEQMLSAAIEMINRAPTMVEHTDRNHRNVKTYMNMSVITNPGMVEWLKATHPRIAMRLPGDIRTTDPTRPDLGQNAFDQNNKFIQNNASPQDIVNSSYTSSMDQDNPVLRRMNEKPITGMTRSAFGGVTFLNLSNDDRRFLQQMIPLSNVTMLIAEYSSRLNKEDYAFMAALTAAGQTIDSWFGLEFFLDPSEPNITDKERELRIWDQERASAGDRRITTEQRTNLKTLQGLASDDLIHLARLRNAFAGLYAELGGERGRKTEDDVKRAKQMLTGLGDTAGTTQRSMNLIFTNFIDQYDGILYGTRETLDQKIAMMEHATSCWMSGGFWNYKSMACESPSGTPAETTPGTITSTPLEFAVPSRFLGIQ